MKPQSDRIVTSLQMARGCRRQEHLREEARRALGFPSTLPGMAGRQGLPAPRNRDEAAASFLFPIRSTGGRPLRDGRAEACLQPRQPGMHGRVPAPLRREMSSAAAPRAAVAVAWNGLPTLAGIPADPLCRHVGAGHGQGDASGQRGGKAEAVQAARGMFCRASARDARFALACRHRTCYACEAAQGWP